MKYFNTKQLSRHAIYTGLFTGGVVTQYYINKILSMKDDQLIKAREAKNDALLTSVESTYKYILDNVGQLKESVITRLDQHLDTMIKGVESKEDKVINEENINKMNAIGDKVQSFKKSASELENSSNVDDVTTTKVKDFIQKASEIDNDNIKLINDITKQKLIENFNTNFISDYTKYVHDYLDTLTLHEVSCLLNIIIFIVLILTGFIILSMYYANHIIDYFKLEERYPKISRILKIKKNFTKVQHNVEYLFIIFNMSIWYFRKFINIPIKKKIFKLFVL